VGLSPVSCYQSTGSELVRKNETDLNRRKSIVRRYPAIQVEAIDASLFGISLLQHKANSPKASVKESMNIFKKTQKVVANVISLAVSYLEIVCDVE
jgi:hypothetical protein